MNSLCNTYCGHSSHSEYNFCTSKAWHMDDHTFDHKHDKTSNLIDICFCCDTTGSMGGYLSASKDAIKAICDSVTSCNVLFGFVAYRDHPPEDTSYVTQTFDLTNYSGIMSFVNSLSAGGGGDFPEAVMDGLFDSINKMSWRENSNRYIFHILDAPPHGTKYYSGATRWPSGCPCGITIEMIGRKLKDNKIKYKLLKIGSDLNIMESIFRSQIPDMETSDLSNAPSLISTVTDIIHRDIKNEEFDFKKI
jgi:hypothetical protein